MELKEREEVDMEGTPQPTVHVVPSKPQDDKKNVGITVVIGAVLLYILVPDKVVAAVQMLATLPLEQVGAAVLYLGLGAFAAATGSLFRQDPVGAQALAGAGRELVRPCSLAWQAAGIFLVSQPAQKRSLNHFEPTEEPNHLPDLEKLNVLDGRLEKDIAAFVEYQKQQTKMKGE